MSKKYMMKRVKTLVLITLLFSSLTGCWSSHEIDDYAVIDVMGIDKNENGEYEITASIVKSYQIFSLTSKISADETGGTALIVTTRGNSLVQAISRLSNSIPRRVYFGHLNVLIFGNKLVTEENLETTLDFFKRENDFRPNIQLYVTKGDAKTIVRTKPELEPTLGLEIKAMHKTTRYASSSMVKDLSKFSESLSSDTAEPFTGVLSNALKNEDKNQDINFETINPEGGEIINQEATVSALSMNGTAVFKGGKLVGYLNKHESTGLLWLKADLIKEVIVVPCGDGSNNQNISLIIRDVNTTITPRRKGTNIDFNVDINAEGEISEITCPNYHLSSTDIEKMNKKVETQINQEISALLKKIKEEWKTDIVGFGDKVNMKYPRTWNKKASTWNDEGFSQAKMKLNIDFSISRYGLYKD